MWKNIALVVAGIFTGAVLSDYATEGEVRKAVKCKFGKCDKCAQAPEVVSAKPE